MENFIIYNPVKLHFGKGIVGSLGKVAKPYGNKVLLMYGAGSVKINGSYQDVVNQLNKIDAEIYEYSGIKSNPIVEDVEKAVSLGIEKKVDFIVAIGGGSVIDSAKLTSVCINENLPPWRVMKGLARPKTSVPLISVLTIAATGSEMNGMAVVQNSKTKQKVGYYNELMFPKHSFLDPVYTFSVSPEYTAYGIVDLISHSFEAFFAKGESDLSDRFIQSIVHTAMKYANPVLQEPDNYDYRANILLQSTCALNGITAYGKATGGDWGVHGIGHTLSFLYDVPHGASLSIVYLAWFKLQKDRIPDRILKLAKLLFNVNSIDEFIAKLRSFFKQIKAPISLSEIGISENHFPEIMELLVKNRVSGYNHKLNKDDYAVLLEYMR